MLYLHGSDERGTDNEGQLSGPAPSILESPDRFNFIIVFPQCPPDRFWDKELIPVAIAELDQTVNDFGGDPSRLYLAGFSLGGYGAWTTAAIYPTKFAAIIPMSGRLLPRPAERKNFPPEILKLADSDDPFAAFANVLKETPTWIYHGSNDNIVPIANSRNMAKALQQAGNPDVHYTELENTGHVSLNAAMADQQLFDWLSHHRRE
jgi:predicted peptidase